MNYQDILNKNITKFDVTLDYSEYYDFELVEIVIGKIDIILDYSEYYDFELVEIVIGKIDIVLDYSEYYDFTLANNFIDYESNENVIIEGKFLITQDEYLLSTEDNYIIEYN